MQLHFAPLQTPAGLSWALTGGHALKTAAATASEHEPLDVQSAQTVNLPDASQFVTGDHSGFLIGALCWLHPDIQHILVLGWC